MKCLKDRLLLLTRDSRSLVLDGNRYSGFVDIRSDQPNANFSFFAKLDCIPYQVFQNQEKYITISEDGRLRWAKSSEGIKSIVI